jgi:hypothetical protein
LVLFEILRKNNREMVEILRLQPQNTLMAEASEFQPFHDYFFSKFEREKRHG